MRYINKYTTSGDVQTALENETLVKPYVAYITSEDKIDYNSQSVGPAPYEEQYLTFEIISGGTIIWTNVNDTYRVISYSLDSGTTWTEWNSRDSYGISVNNGDIIMLKGDNSSYSSTYSAYAYFSATTEVRFNIYGNIMSLIDSTGFATATTLTDSYNFNRLFRTSDNSVGIVDASNLVLPATSLTEGCYQQMFSNCPYLTTAPALPATTLADYCYNAMFRYCSSLSAITCLATDISASNCTKNWLNDVSATGTFTKAASMQDWTTGVSGIPDGWTVIDAS